MTRVIDSDGVDFIFPLIEEYAEKVNNDSQVAIALSREILSNLSSPIHMVIAGVDMDTGDVIAYAFARIVDNYGDRFVYVVQIFSSSPGAGRLLFEWLMGWGEEFSCRSIRGFVPYDNFEITARLWKAIPEKVFMRREIYGRHC